MYTCSFVISKSLWKPPLSPPLEQLINESLLISCTYLVSYSTFKLVLSQSKVLYQYPKPMHHFRRCSIITISSYTCLVVVTPYYVQQPLPHTTRKWHNQKYKGKMVANKGTCSFFLPITLTTMLALRLWYRDYVHVWFVVVFLLDELVYSK